MSIRCSGLVICSLDKGIVWALPLSVLLHATGLLLADDPSSWLPAIAGYSDVKGRGRLEAIIQRGQGLIAGEISDTTARLGLAEHHELQPEGVAHIPLEREGVARDFSGGERHSVSEKYHPRSELSSHPKPLQEITVQWPGERALPESVAVEYILHIDEVGVVREAIPDTQTPLPDVDEVVKNAFLGALFSPGQIGGLPVRSRIRIEVVFGSTSPLPKPVVVSERKSL